MALWSFSSQSGWGKCNLHGTQSGSTAIIVGNGPSLEDINTTRICGANRFAIAINNAWPAVFRPDWWVGMDGIENYNRGLIHQSFPKLMRKCHSLQFPAVFVPDLRDDVPFYGGSNPDADWRWDKDSFRVAIQLAIYLGAKAIAFCGVDLNLSNGDYAGGNTLNDEQRRYNQALYDQTFDFLEKFKRARPDIRMMSLSNGSRINSIFRYMDFDSAIQMWESGVDYGAGINHVIESNSC